ncbi:MAG: LytTR family transcriptional regulator DNA-binding domain-containing protein [Streptococcus orisratti]|uniref:LytTR family DNA-binding domain-containing protein n=1 Tax=Streptococcus TaxID=1301 RepID=UPI002356ECF6|nr:LytTR family DNA-binding domain-containing protein [Streptococcus orisratti]MCI7677333.1 LytTR family transcriptional regulator DNA-binding domain-containing protein [Streptococcus orisratti]
MDFRFEEVPNLTAEEIEVLVRSRSLTAEVQHILDYLAQYEAEAPAIIPIKGADRIEMLKIDDLIYVDVDDTSLILETLKGRRIISGRLYKFKERLNNPDFVQVSKQSLLNINHLEALEASFSGNMLALLTGKRKLHVSRRYLKNLEQRLGL